MAKRYAVTTEIAERRRLPPKLFVILAGTNDLLAYPVIEEDKIVNAISAMVDAAAVDLAVAVVCTVPRMPAPEERSPDFGLTKRRYRLNELIVEKFGPVHIPAGDLLRAAVKEGTPAGLEAKVRSARGDRRTRAKFRAVAYVTQPALKPRNQKKRPQTF